MSFLANILLDKHHCYLFRERKTNLKGNHVSFELNFKISWIGMGACPWALLEGSPFV